MALVPTDFWDNDLQLSMIRGEKIRIEIFTKACGVLALYQQGKGMQNTG